MVAEGFVGAMHTLADVLGPLTDDAARDFMQRFPLDSIFRLAQQLACSTPCL